MMTWLIRPTSPHPALGIVVSAALIATESVLAVLLTRVAPGETFALVYLVGVLAVSLVWEFGLAVATSIASALAFDYFHDWPPGFSPAGAQNWVTAAAFLVVALSVNTVALVARSRADEAVQRRREADLGAELARLMLRSGGSKSAMDAAADHLAYVLGLPFADLEPAVVLSDRHRCAIALAEGATLLVPAGLPAHTMQRLRERVVPSLEELLRATRELEAINCALEASRRDLERFFELSSDLLCIAGPDGFYKRINPGFEKILGYPTQELLARPFLDFVHPADRLRTSAALDELTRGNPIAQFESRFVCKDGSARWVEWNTVPERGVLYAAGRDVTERRESQQMIETSHAALRVLAKQQASLRRVATLVAQGATPSRVFTAVTDELARVLGGYTTCLYRYDPDGRSTLIASHTGPGIEPTQVGTHISLEGENVAAMVLTSGRAARMDSYRDANGPAAALTRDVGINSEVGVPIVVGGHLWGVASVGSAGTDPLPPDTESRMGDFTELVATAIENAQTRAQLTASRTRIVTAADDARRRLERDLHDGAQQRLVSLGLALRSAEASVTSEPAKLKDQISDIVAGLDGISAELREISRGIHPAILSSGGLGPALKALARRSVVPVDLELSLGSRVPETTEVTAYYVAAEALTNTAKHAHASEIYMHARTDAAKLELTVRDDGIGGADSGKGSGLIGLRDRVEARGGWMDITSHSGTGTAIHVEIPLEVR